MTGNQFPFLYENRGRNLLTTAAAPVIGAVTGGFKNIMEQGSGATEGSPRETLRNLVFKAAGLSGKHARAH
jgi:hypothetical protein